MNSPIAAGSSGQVWMIGPSNSIQQYAPGGLGKPATWPQVTGIATRIALDKAKPWVINPTGGIYRNNWEG